MANKEEQIRDPELRRDSSEWLRAEAGRKQYLARASDDDRIATGLLGESDLLIRQAVAADNEIAAYGQGGLNGRLDEGIPPAVDESAGRDEIL